MCATGYMGLAIDLAADALTDVRGFVPRGYIGNYLPRSLSLPGQSAPGLRPYQRRLLFARTCHAMTLPPFERRLGKRPLGFRALIVADNRQRVILAAPNIANVIMFARPVVAGQLIAMIQRWPRE